MSDGLVIKSWRDLRLQSAQAARSTVSRQACLHALKIHRLSLQWGYGPTVRQASFAAAYGRLCDFFSRDFHQRGDGVRTTICCVYLEKTTRDISVSRSRCSSVLNNLNGESSCWGNCQRAADSVLFEGKPVYHHRSVIFH